MKVLWTLLLGFALLPHNDDATKTADHFGAEVIDVIKQAKSVVAYRIKPGEESTKYTLTSKQAKLANKAATELKGLLPSDATYYWGPMGKGCIPQPGVLFRFSRGADTVDVLVCYDCAMLAMGKHGEKPKWEDFDPAYNKLLAIAKAVFPQDTEIQGIKARAKGD
jgi:hypothetical protein